MRKFNKGNELHKPASRLLYGSKRTLQLLTTVFLTAAVFVGETIAAEIPDASLPEKERHASPEQRQKLINRGMEAHAALSERLEVKLQMNLMRSVIPYDGLPEYQVLAPEWQPSCADNADDQNRRSPGNCVAENS